MTIEHKAPQSYVDMLAGMIPQSWKRRLMLGGAFLPAIAATLVTAIVLSLFCPWYVVVVAAIIMGGGAFITGIAVVAANESTLVEHKEKGEGREIARLQGRLRHVEIEHGKLKSNYQTLLNEKEGLAQTLYQQEQAERNRLINSFLANYPQESIEGSVDLNDSLIYSPYPTQPPAPKSTSSDNRTTKESSVSSISSEYSLEILNTPQKQERADTPRPHSKDITCDTHYLPDPLVVGPATEKLVNEREGGRNK